MCHACSRTWVQCQTVTSIAGSYEGPTVVVFIVATLCAYLDECICVCEVWVYMRVRYACAKWRLNVLFRYIFSSLEKSTVCEFVCCDGEDDCRRGGAQLANNLRANAYTRSLYSKMAGAWLRGSNSTPSAWVIAFLMKNRLFLVCLVWQVWSLIV